MLEAVTLAAKSVDRNSLIAAQQCVSSFTGERSNREIYDFCLDLANQRQDWDCHLIEGADHALSFQKPERIAQLMDADLTRAAMPLPASA